MGEILGYDYINIIKFHDDAPSAEIDKAMAFLHKQGKGTHEDPKNAGVTNEAGVTLRLTQTATSLAATFKQAQREFPKVRMTLDDSYLTAPELYSASTCALDLTLSRAPVPR